MWVKGRVRRALDWIYALGVGVPSRLTGKDDEGGHRGKALVGKGLDWAERDSH